MPKFSVCGIDCGKCRFRTEMNCAGCRENKGMMFWGKCDIFFCSSNDKELGHCGQCENFPCEMLKSFASSENPERIDNLKKLRIQEEK